MWWRVTIVIVFSVNVFCTLGKPVDYPPSTIQEEAFAPPPPPPPLSQVNIVTPIHPVPVQIHQVPSYVKGGYASAEDEEKFTATVMKATLAMADSGILAAQQVLQSVRTEVLDAFKLRLQETPY